jgi:hypothetical protein
LDVLDKYKISFEKINGGPDGAIYVFNKVMERLKENKNAR